MFLVILEEEEYFSNSGSVCCLGPFSPFFFFFFFFSFLFPQKHPPGSCMASSAATALFWGQITVPKPGAFQGESGPSPFCNFPFPLPKGRCSGWSGFLPAIPRHSKKVILSPICASPLHPHCWCQEELGDGARHLALFRGLKPPTNG